MVPHAFIEGHSPQLRHLENLYIDMTVKSFDDFVDEDEIWILFANLGLILSRIDTFAVLQIDLHLRLPNQ